MSHPITEREKLYKQLEDSLFEGTTYIGSDGHIALDPWEIVDWIIADRRRIVAPLVKLKEDKYKLLKMVSYAVNETLKLAGVE